jgi:hypothetical protein
MCVCVGAKRCERVENLSMAWTYAYRRRSREFTEPRDESHVKRVII